MICRETVDWLQGINTMEGLPYGQLAFAHGLSERSTSAPCPVRPERLRVPGALLRPPVIGPHCALGMAHALRRLFHAVSVPKRKPRSAKPAEKPPHTLFEPVLLDNKTSGGRSQSMCGKSVNKFQPKDLSIDVYA